MGITFDREHFERMARFQRDLADLMARLDSLGRTNPQANTPEAREAIAANDPLHRRLMIAGGRAEHFILYEDTQELARRLDAPLFDFNLN